MNFVYYVLTREYGDEQRADFDRRIGLTDTQTDDDLLPEELRGVEPPSWWTETPAGVNPATWAASLG